MLNDVVMILLIKVEQVDIVGPYFMTINVSSRLYQYQGA